MAVNVLALFWLRKAFHARDGGTQQRTHRDHRVPGRRDPVPGMSDYVASKHAAYGFAESLRDRTGR